MTSFEDSYVDLIPQSMTAHPVLSDLFGTFITSATVERKASLFLAGLVCILNPWHCAAQSWEQRRCSPAHRLLSPARSLLTPPLLANPRPPGCCSPLFESYEWLLNMYVPQGGSHSGWQESYAVYCKGLGQF